MMKTNKKLKLAASALVAASWLAMGVVQADDTDIYGGAPGAAGAPNLMILLDNTASWNSNSQHWKPSTSYANCIASFGVGITAADTATCVSVINDTFDLGSGNTTFGTTTIKQGLMQVRVIKRTLKSTVCSGNADAIKINLGLTIISRTKGGNVVHAVQPTAGTPSSAGTSCAALFDKLNTIEQVWTGSSGAPWQGPANADYGSSMFEIFKYFGGWKGLPIGDETVAGTPVSANAFGPTRYSPVITEDDPDAFLTGAKAVYKSPIGTGASCNKNYIMLVGNGFPNQEGSGTPEKTLMTVSGTFGVPAEVDALTSGPARTADDWAYFLANTDVSSADGIQSVNTFTVDIFGESNDANQTKLLKKMALVGGIGSSGYYVVNNNPNELVKAFTKILIRIAAVDSVFTAASLPVSTTTQGSFINQIFVGMFRPQVSQRWWGNLKQYKLGFNAAKDVLVMDADGASAVDSNSGFFGATAKSFWTTSSSFFTDPLAMSGTPKSASDLPDGAVVEKGGAAQRLRVKNQTLINSTGRKVLTTSSGALSDLVGGDSDGNGTTLDANAVKWIKGSKSDKTDAYPGYDNAATPLPVDVRPSIHGDVLHSRPVAVNFGKVNSPGETAPTPVDNVVVFYGTNDGLLHAIDGRQGSSTGGNEYWSFLPIESYKTADKNYKNEEIIAPQVNSATGSLNTPMSGAAFKKYGVDGGIGVFASYASGVVSKAMIYPTMRRGGSAVYAFDVSATLGGTSPTLSWVKRPTSTGFARLGQTWSTPKAVVLKKATYTASENVVVMFGGGYNPQEDNPSITTVDDTGKALYIVDAFNGTLRKALTGSGADAITGAVASDVTVVDTDFDGAFDRIYFADVRGGVYRVNMVDPTSGATDLFANWTVKKIAQFDDRKIFHAPDVVVSANFISVMVGTGDREKPLVAATGENFYLIKDNKIGGTEKTLLTQTELSQIASVANNGVITAITPTTMSADGCYFSLATNGEKVVNTPLSIAGVTYFGTNKPATSTSNSCSGSLGQARAYQVPLFCGVPKSSEIISGGYPPSPVGGLVNIKNGQGVDELVPFVIGSGISTTPKGSAFEAIRPKPIIPASRKKDFWRVLPAGTGNR